MTANKFDSIASIVNYLREPLPTEEVTSTKAKTKKRTKKEQPVESNSPSTESDELAQKLPKGRVKYGPITVHPRSEPSKTLFTGRRSKNEVLCPDEEERRRDRRERNRIAATKCREKRETVLHQLEEECQMEEAEARELNQLIESLQTQKHQLELELSQHSDACFMYPNLINEYQPAAEASMIFGDPTFLSSMPETRAPPMPLNEPIVSSSEEEEQNTPPIGSAPLLTNSAYSNDDSNTQFLNQEDMMIAFTTSSLERLMISIRSPTQSMDINNSSMGLVNSSESATCAKQSGFSEEESLAPTIGTRFIC